MGMLLLSELSSHLQKLSIILELKANMLLRLIRDCAGYNRRVDSVWELGGQCSVLESYHW